LRSDSSTFEVLDLCKYYQNCIKYIGIDIYINPIPQKLISPLSTLNTWCQVIAKIQKCPKPVEATLGCHRVGHAYLFKYFKYAKG